MKLFLSSDKATIKSLDKIPFQKLLYYELNNKEILASYTNLELLQKIKEPHTQQVGKIDYSDLANSSIPN